MFLILLGLYICSHDALADSYGGDDVDEDLFVSRQPSAAIHHKFPTTRYVVNRDVFVQECPWLDQAVVKGTKVFQYMGDTFGAITHNGIAVTMKPNTEPFFELPRDSLELEDDDDEIANVNVDGISTNAATNAGSEAHVNRDENSKIEFDESLLASRRGDGKNTLNCDTYRLKRFTDFVVIRKVTKKECPWLSADIEFGQKVERYTGATYGVVSPCGLAVTIPGKEDEGFIELPGDALEPAE